MERDKSVHCCKYDVVYSGLLRFYLSMRAHSQDMERYNLRTVHRLFGIYRGCWSGKSSLGCYNAGHANLLDYEAAYLVKTQDWGSWYIGGWFIVRRSGTLCYHRSQNLT